MSAHLFEPWDYETNHMYNHGMRLAQRRFRRAKTASERRKWARIYFRITGCLPEEMLTCI